MTAAIKTLTAIILSAAFALTASAQDAASGSLLDGAKDLPDMPAVKLRALDKITARITELDITVGEEVRFGSLAIRPRYCRTRDPLETPETFAYLEIDNLDHNQARERVFEGWMIASSPALNALEHPVYDVWVISCNAAAPVSGNGPSE